MEADGSGVVPVYSGPGIALNPAWSPCTQIAFSALAGGRPGQVPSRPYLIYVMDADGSNVRAVTDGTDGDLLPSWSPDCSKIAFTRYFFHPDGPIGADIWIVNADGSGLRKLTRRE